MNASKYSFDCLGVARTQRSCLNLSGLTPFGKGVRVTYTCDEFLPAHFPFSSWKKLNATTSPKNIFFNITKIFKCYSMVQIYDQLRYIPNICTYILLKTPYFALKKFTRASFLSALAKSVGIRSVRLSVRFDAFRLGIKKPRTVTGPGLPLY